MSRHVSNARPYDRRVTREDWLRQRTFNGSSFDPEALAAAKARTGTTVSVILPALDVEETVGAICTSIRERWTGRGGLVDDIVVIDSLSSDATARVAAEAGARVVQDRSLVTSAGPGRGKGEALWKSLAATSTDIVVWIDSDIRDFDAAFVPGLLGPLLADDEVGYVKALYRRPYGGGGGGGGRVTEICARPLINRYFPDLAGFVQPLSGEAAGRRDLLERVPFLTGYAVEIGLLIDILHAAGLDAMAQVDLGERHHVNQPTAALGRMAYEITHAVLARAEGRPVGADALPAYARPVPNGAGYGLDVTPVPLIERPPMAGMPPEERAR